MPSTYEFSASEKSYREKLYNLNWITSNRIEQFLEEDD